MTDRFVDVVQEGYDIAVRSHFTPLPASGLVQRQLVSEPIILVATPDYRRRGNRWSVPSSSGAMTASWPR
ncbi:hypothetical protein ACN28S_20910 [Cystobacter fuscus]